MVIATGGSARHVNSLSEKVIANVKSQTGTFARTEGLNNSDWVLIDCGDIVVHIFRQEVRDFYQLERIWQSGGRHKLDLGTV